MLPPLPILKPEEHSMQQSLSVNMEKALDNAGKPEKANTIIITYNNSSVNENGEVTPGGIVIDINDVKS